MTRHFHGEVYVAAAVMIVAGAAYRAGIAYLPGTFLLIGGILLMGIFAELEDETLMKIKGLTIESHDWHLTLLRMIRGIVLLSVAALVFAALLPRP
jgi:hypothetical protein